MKPIKKAKFAYLVFVISILTMIAGCATQEKQPVSENAGLGLSDKASTLTTATATIDSLAPQPAVKAETKKINVVANSLHKDDEKVREIQAKIIRMESESEQSRQKYLSWAFLFGGICIIVGLALLAISIKLSFLGHYGLIVSVFGIMVVAGSRFFATYDLGVIAIGVVCIFSLIGYGIYFFLKAHKKNQSFIQEKADLKLTLVDSLKTTELLKSKARGAWEEILPIVKKIQNPVSMDIIKELKKTEINNPI